MTTVAYFTDYRAMAPIPLPVRLNHTGKCKIVTGGKNPGKYYQHKEFMWFKQWVHESRLTFYAAENIVFYNCSCLDKAESTAKTIGD
jgi:hypothetical protein